MEKVEDNKRRKLATEERVDPVAAAVEKGIRRYVPLGEQDEPFTTTAEQRTPAWFELRKRRITGSALSGFLFGDDLQQKYDQIFHGAPKPPFSEEAKGYMKYGQEHEMDAVQTLLDAYQHYTVFEAGLQPSKELPFLAASPDGVIRCNKTGEHMVLEIKCPAKRKQASDKIPYYYVFQLYMEMFCLGLKKCCFVSWGPLKSHVWHVDFDEKLWENIVVYLSLFKFRKFDEVTAKTPGMKMRCIRFVNQYEKYDVVDSSFFLK